MFIYFILSVCFKIFALSAQTPRLGEQFKRDFSRKEDKL